MQTSLGKKRTKTSRAKAAAFEDNRPFAIRPDFCLRPVYSAAACLWAAIVGGGFGLAFFKGMDSFSYACLIATAVLVTGHAADCIMHRPGGFWRKLRALGSAGMGGFLLGPAAGIIQVPLLAAGYWLVDTPSPFHPRDIVLIPLMSVIIATAGLFIPFTVFTLACGFFYSGWKSIFPGNGKASAGTSATPNYRFRFYLSCAGIAFAVYVTAISLALDYPPGRAPSRYNRGPLFRQFYYTFLGETPPDARMVSAPSFTTARISLYVLAGLAVLGILLLVFQQIRKRRTESKKTS